MKVEIWSDIACPFCYIGKRRFAEALSQFDDREQVEVIYRSFELDPRAPKDVEHDIYEELAAKYGISRGQAIEMNENVGGMAETVGLTFNFETMIITNTFDAHRLIHLAQQHGKVQEMTERIFQAYFVESQHVGEQAVLAQLGEDVGIDKQEVLQMLKGTEYTNEVRADEQEAQRLGVNGVPFFVINRKYGISGAQSSELFLNTLQKARDEEPKL